MPGLEIDIGFGLAFLAGLVSFLSPCVLPVVPGYITFVSGVTMDDLSTGDVRGTRLRAAGHALLFAFGFLLVFMTLGIAASTFGRQLNQWLPAITRAGGVLIVLFGLHLLGVFRRIGVLQREHRLHLSTRPAGWLGSVGIGIAFGAGWTPCIGPVLGSILLYSGIETTATEGMLLLASYGLGLAVPFVGSAVAFNWFLAGAARMKRWLPWIQRGTGTLLVVVGLMMVTGHFARLAALLADMGQLITLEP